MTQQLTKPEKTQSRSDPPENSTELRLICVALAVISLCAACHYTHVPPVITVILIWLAIAGSSVSYYLRNTKNAAVAAVTITGLLIVLAVFAQEMYVQFFAAHMDMLVPFIHVLTGLLALHTWDLRTRLDLNANALIGMGVMCCTLVLGRDILFGALVCIYIWLCATLLYFEAASRTKSSGRYTPSEPMSPSRMIMTREGGSAMVPIATIPILGLVFFLCLPRVSSIFDLIVVNFNRIVAPQPVPVPGVGGSGSASSTFSGSALPPPSDNSIRNGVPSTDATGARIVNTGKGKGTASGPAEGPAEDGMNSASTNGKGGKAELPESSALPPEDQLFFRDKTAAQYDDELLFTVSAPGDYYYRRLAFDNYDGHKWTVSKGGMLSKCRRLNGGLYQELGGVPSLFLPPDYPASSITQEFTVKSNMGHVIPVVSMPQKIDFPSDPLLVDGNGVVKTDSLLKPGMIYHVFSQVANYNLDDMRGAGVDQDLEERARKEFANCLVVPKEVPAEVRDLAVNVAGKEGNWFTKSERILKFLRANFKYADTGDDVPKDRDLVDAFLFEKKQGACGPFASAFVIMCRVNNIPARVVGGFAPGEYNGLTGLREVHGRHGHAWAEAWIPKWGWVPFDPIPLGVLPTPPEEDTSFMAQLAKNLSNFQRAINPPKQATPAARSAEQAGPNAVPTTDAPQQYPNGANSGGGGKLKEGGTVTGGPSGNTPGKAVEKKAGVEGNAAPPAPGEKKEEKKDAPIKLPDLSGDSSDPTHSKVFWWLQGFVVLALIPGTLLVAQAIRAVYLHFKAMTDYKKTAKTSTVLYLRMVDDLKRFKISRSPSDTSEEFSVRFKSAVDSGMPVHPELPPLIEQFMQAYADDRFGAPAGSEQRIAELQGISDKIHNLARMKVA
ncbi:MAG TPA: DUF3488 and transglutaminase-like domain-containing protein [Planktothrix sp.]|jgi:transglutaminase-like putative cysteine protease